MPPKIEINQEGRDLEILEATLQDHADGRCGKQKKYTMYVLKQIYYISGKQKNTICMETYGPPCIISSIFKTNRRLYNLYNFADSPVKIVYIADSPVKIQGWPKKIAPLDKVP